MKRILLISLLMILCISLSSEMSDKFMNPSIYTPSIFSLNNITMNHTISFSAGVSSNNQSFYQSLYTNHINYQISPKLNFKLDLNFVNFGTATYNRNFDFEGNGDNQSVVLPEFSLSCEPTENMKIVIEYRNVSMQSPWYNTNPWYRD